MDIGAGNDIAFVPLVAASPKNFFRLQYSDVTSNDFDNDGLSNQLEVETYGTEPFNPDTDGDGMPDGWEVTYGLNPLSATDAGLDSDAGGGDGLTNLQEYQIGTNPKKKDSDDDGLADNVEYNSGGDPVHFDMPEFTLVSAPRESDISEEIERPIAGSPTRHGYVEGYSIGTSAGVLQEVFVRELPAVPTTIYTPWNLNNAANSSWIAGSGIPAPGQPVAVHPLNTPLYASRLDTMHGDGSATNDSMFISVMGQTDYQESRSIRRHAVMRERTVRVKATRAMPAAWSIPYTRSVNVRSSREGNWNSPTISTGNFTFTTGQIYSNAVVMDLASTAAAGSPIPVRPGRKRTNSTSPWVVTLLSETQAVEWLTIEKIDPLTTNPNTDTDGDGVSNLLEDKMGTSKTTRNSDGAGYADGDQINLALLPPVNGLLIATREVDYHYSPEDPYCPYHPANRLGAITDLPIKNSLQDPNGPKIGIDATFHSTVAARAPFPSTPPTASPMPILTPDGDSAAKPEARASMTYNKTADGTTETGKGKQRRVWGQLAEAPPANMSTTYLKVRTETKTPATNPPTSSTFSLVTFLFTPASALSTNFEDLLAQRTSPPGSGTGTAAVVTEDLLPVEVRAFQNVNGPHGSLPMYAPPQPHDGQLFGDLLSAWPNEKITFGIAEPIAGMIGRNELPAGFVKWTADGITGKNNVNTFDVQWPTHGLKNVDLQIGTATFHLYVNVPDTKNLDFFGGGGQNPISAYNADFALRAVIGNPEYLQISLVGVQMQQRVAVRYGQTGGTGGARQDAIRHSSWNAGGAAAVGKSKMIVFSTANEFHGRYSDAGFASNTTMDLHNNDAGATAGNTYFLAALPKDPETLIDEMEAKFNSGDFRIWTPPNADVNHHSHILKNSNGTKIFAP